MRQTLTLEDHQKLAAHLSAVDQHLNAMLDILSGKAPAPVIDQLVTASQINKYIYKLRSSLEGVIMKQFGRGSWLYWSGVVSQCSTRATIDTRHGHAGLDRSAQYSGIALAVIHFQGGD